MAKKRKAPERPKVPVSKRAIMQRINRKLAPEFRQLKKCREGQWHRDLGDFYTVNLENNGIDLIHIDLEEFARKLECLQPWEEVAKD